MWSFERRLRVGAVLLLAGLSLAACNVRPLYAPDAGAGSGEMTQILASIHVSEPDSRVEQVLRNALMFRLSGGGQGGDAYELDLRTTSSASSVLVRTIGGKPQARFVKVTTSYQLRRTGADEVLESGTISRESSFDWSDQRFANERAQLDAENRAATALADDLHALLAGYFASAARR